MIERVVWKVYTDYDDTYPNVWKHVLKGESEEDLTRRFGDRWKPNAKRGDFDNEADAIRHKIVLLEQMKREIDDLIANARDHIEALEGKC